jgi:hypothetical protein
MREMVGGCCVCSDDRGWSENPLVYCDGQSCTVAVHQGNYTPFHKSHIEFNFFVLKVNKNHPKTGQMVISSDGKFPEIYNLEIFPAKISEIFPEI